FCLDYIDGSLPEDERERFTQHLVRCRDCVVFFETYRKTPELTREALDTQIPPAVREAVRSFLRAKRESSSPRALRPFPLASSPAVARHRSDAFFDGGTPLAYRILHVS